MKSDIDICAACVHDEPGYSSVIGVIPHCCKHHWHCKPGAEAFDFQEKPEQEENHEPDED